MIFLEQWREIPLIEFRRQPGRWFVSRAIVYTVVALGIGSLGTAFAATYSFLVSRMRELPPTTGTLPEFDPLTRQNLVPDETVLKKGDRLPLLMSMPDSAHRDRIAMASRRTGVAQLIQGDGDSDPSDDAKAALRIPTTARRPPETALAATTAPPPKGSRKDGLPSTSARAAAVRSQVALVPPRKEDTTAAQIAVSASANPTKDFSNTLEVLDAEKEREGDQLLRMNAADKKAVRKAISMYRAALANIDREDKPADWARLQGKIIKAESLLR
ncbi:hypothetical protein ACQR0Z_30230 [Bradyrhizobium sp. HKCCYLS3077]|uniref:hypothetical protein n=1 Tax=Bradyrhizobium sp. HKCCYLS3077 TaxID=3420761 RepID=UPI003EBBF486